jgi:hypothetical protein
MKNLLRGLLLLGVIAVCNDTRGATWLLVPGALAGVVLFTGPSRERMQKTAGAVTPTAHN